MIDSIEKPEPELQHCDNWELLKVPKLQNKIERSFITLKGKEPKPKIYYRIPANEIYLQGLAKPPNAVRYIESFFIESIKVPEPKIQHCENFELEKLPKPINRMQKQTPFQLLSIRKGEGIWQVITKEPTVLLTIQSVQKPENEISYINSILVKGNLRPIPEVQHCDNWELLKIPKMELLPENVNEINISVKHKKIKLLKHKQNELFIKGAPFILEIDENLHRKSHIKKQYNKYKIEYEEIPLIAQSIFKFNIKGKNKSPNIMQKNSKINILGKQKLKNIRERTNTIFISKEYEKRPEIKQFIVKPDKSIRFNIKRIPTKKPKLFITKSKFTLLSKYGRINLLSQNAMSIRILNNKIPAKPIIERNKEIFIKKSKEPLYRKKISRVIKETSFIIPKLKNNYNNLIIQSLSLILKRIRKPKQKYEGMRTVSLTVNKKEKFLKLQKNCDIQIKPKYNKNKKKMFIQRNVSLFNKGKPNKKLLMIKKYGPMTIEKEYDFFRLTSWNSLGIQGSCLSLFGNPIGQRLATQEVYKSGYQDVAWKGVPLLLQRCCSIRIFRPKQIQIAWKGIPLILQRGSSIRITSLYKYSKRKEKKHKLEFIK
jgi:hypothetical protein